MTQTPPSETSDADANSRRAKLVARRGRRSRITIVALIVAIAGAAAAGAYAYNAHDPAAHAAGTTGTTAKPGSFGKEGTLVAPAAIKVGPPRPLTHADPLKLWIGGDSLAGSFGPALGDQVGETGVVKTVIDYKVSSGLFSNDIRNWYERATEQMASDNPDAVVFIIGANDSPIVNKVDENGDGVPDGEVGYRLKVDRMMSLLVGPNHRTVFWLGPPTLGTDSTQMNSGAKALGVLMQQEAAKYAPDVVYLDTYKLFANKNGDYSRSIVDETGKTIVARISDGVHFTEDGAQYLARAVFALIDARWQLTKQADLADPIGWTLASGSGESVPGFASAPRSRYHSSQNQSSGTSYGSGSGQSGGSGGSGTTVFQQSSTLPPVASTSIPVATVPSTAPTITATTKPTTPTTPTTAPHPTPTTVKKP
jgi:uncharacterized protein